ncbi:MAG: type II toxin-antitoxin system VapC family toxin [Chitinophagaceae bacterium]|jgi:tRNA(fMet)-specific endonuclease VapC|nr:type II toxin-antitoxin system VapC family toxin [Chitinophagaceae bacterium]
MIGNNYLLDTGIVIEVFNGNKNIANKVNHLSQFYITSVVLGELYVGIHRVSNKDKHYKKLIDFLQLCAVLEVDNTTAEHYGEIVTTLYKKGKPIPTNDIWIAASAIQYNLTLAARDKHFDNIDGLKIEMW